MISKFLKRRLQGGNYLPRYPTISKQMEWQLSGLGILPGLIYVILNVDGTDGNQDAPNTVQKLF